MTNLLEAFKIQNRAGLEAIIESLIEQLDQMDGNPDLEEGGDDEQALGWPNHGPSCLRDTVDDDREVEEVSGYGDYEGMIVEEQGEPSLGWTNHIDQDAPDRAKTATFHVDLELDDSDREPTGDEAAATKRITAWDASKVPIVCSGFCPRFDCYLIRDAGGEDSL